MAYISTIVSGAASLGVLIGLISGIFFLVLSALRWVSRVRATLYEEELHRQKFLINNPFIIGPNSADYVDSRKKSNGYASALSGRNPPGKTEETIQRHEASSGDWNRQSGEEKVEEKQETSSDTIQVREFIEKMVETLIGGPLDGTTVGQLSTHSACENEPRFDPSHPARSNLKHLIKRIITEAMALPNIKEILCRPNVTNEPASEDLENKSYEDILATAILNKVIEHFQNKKENENEAGGGYLRRRGGSRKQGRNEDEDEIKSNSDWSDTSRSDQLSLTIEEYIEEVTTAFEVSEDEKGELSDYETGTNRRVPFPESGRTVVDGSDDENSDLEEQSSATELITSTNSWEENWLFQKKRLRSTPNAHHPVPVPMLVPNPSEDYRALVGGVDADDLSDMSDCSDSALEELITKDEEPVSSSSKQEHQELTHHTGEEEAVEVVRVKNGEREAEGVETPCENGKEESLAKLEGPEEKEDGANREAEDDRSSPEEMGEEVKMSSLLPGCCPEAQKDREFSIEDFEFSHCLESANHQTPERTETETETETSNGRGHGETVVRCRIAEREKEKWNHPVPFPDNPYSRENIEKRARRNRMEYFRIGRYKGEYTDFPDDLFPEDLSPRRPASHCFDRDYYVNASKHPSGTFSSSSLSQFSEAHEQVSETRETAPEAVRMENKVQGRKSEFSLPSVKELAKQFTMEPAKESKLQESATKLESKHKAGNHPPEKEVERDCTAVPISEIIHNLKESLASHKQKPNTPPIYTEKQPPTRMEICRRTSNNTRVDNSAERFARNGDGTETPRFNGKQVHSLTARSISREFREGLKNNSYQRSYAKTDRGSSGAESDQGDVIGNQGKTSPTPSIDLKNMKKFWEEKITANSISAKEQ